MSKDLTKTHRNALQKVRDKLVLRQTMTHTQLILGKENEGILDNVLSTLTHVIELLNLIK